MRSFIIAVVILVSASAASLWLSKISDERMDEIIVLTDTVIAHKAQGKEAQDAIALAMEKWKKNEKLFHITINRSEMLIVKKEIAGALGASMANSADDFLVAAERLAVSLDKIKGYTTCRIENVF